MRNKLTSSNIDNFVGALKRVAKGITCLLEKINYKNVTECIWETSEYVFKFVTWAVLIGWLTIWLASADIAGRMWILIPLTTVYSLALLSLLAKKLFSYQDHSFSLADRLFKDGYMKTAALFFLTDLGILFLAITIHGNSYLFNAVLTSMSHVYG